MNEGNVKENGKITEIIGQINGVTNEIKDQILPDLRSKLKSILYSLPNEDRKEITNEQVTEGSRLLMALEEHRRDLVTISNMILSDILRQIEL